MPFEEYQFLRYFIPGSLFVMYTCLFTLPALNISILNDLIEKPDLILGIIGGALAGSLAFGYLIYSFYDTLLYNHLVMNPKSRKLLQYLSKKIPNWSNLENHKKKMIMEMIHTSGDYTKGTDKFYEIIRGWWSHYNARIVCALFVPFLSIAAFLLFLVGDYLLIGAVEIFAFNNQYTALYVFIVPVVLGTSICLWLGSRNPFREATYYEYLFIKNKIEGNEELKTEGKKFQKLIDILLNEEWDESAKAKKQ